MKSRGLLWALIVGGLSLGGCGALFMMKRPPPPSSPKASIAPHAPGQFEIAEVVFDGKFGNGWSDWGWGQHELADGKPARVSFTSYGGIILHHDVLPGPYGGVSFRFQAPPEFGDFLEVSLQYKQVDESLLPPVPVEKKHIAELPGGWREVLIPWAALNPSSSPFDRIQIHANRQVSAALVGLDRIVLTSHAAASASAGPAVPARQVSLSIDCRRPATPINPLIYGVAADPWLTDSPARRLGGNTSTRLNWELGNVWNTGSDWYFENVLGSKTKLPDWIQEDVTHGAKTALTVPMIGWVAKDTTSSGFPISKLGPQRAHDGYRPDAGDGVRPDGKPIQPGAPTETSVPAPPELIRRWIETLREQDRVRGHRGVDMYILDNEPNLWSSTHRDVHPDPLTYDELLDRTLKYGLAVRKADPEAVIAGPAEWGWSGYLYSAKDLAGGLVPHSDQLLHGGVPLLPWYLRKLAAYEKQTGSHILDVVDVHFYPQAAHVYGNDGGTDPQTSALRLRSTRALWDPTYLDESWINDHVGLIPRIKNWISENYPGRGISIGEWNFGAEKHMSGGLAVAEVLGRFGQQGIMSAFYWVTPPPGTPAFFAFRAYRNYDGKGARFLDWSIPTNETPGISLFASRDESGAHVTALLLNLDPEAPVQADVDVSSCGTVASRRVFFYGENAPAIAEHTTGKGAKPLSERLAPYSLTVLELTLSKPSSP